MLQYFFKDSFVGVWDPILGRSCDIEGLARKVSSRSGFLEVRGARAMEKIPVFIKKCFESYKYVRERSKAVLDT